MVAGPMGSLAGPRVVLLLEGQVLVAVGGRADQAQSGVAAGSFHGENQDQESLVQMAVMELRGLAESVGDQSVSGLELFQNGGVGLPNH